MRRNKKKKGNEFLSKPEQREQLSSTLALACSLAVCNYIYLDACNYISGGLSLAHRPHSLSSPFKFEGDRARERRVNSSSTSD